MVVPDAVVEEPTPQAHEGRLHPAAIGVWGIRHVGAIVALLIAGAIEWRLLLGAGVLGVGGSVLWWYQFRWRVEEDAFVIEQGLLERRRRVIPYERIQTVEVGRRLRHRVFGVVELIVETVGSDKAEGTLAALDPDTAQRLRARLLRLEATSGRVRPGEVVGEEPGDLLARMSVGDLLAAGLTGGRVGVAAVVLGLAQEVLGERFADSMQRLPGLFGPQVLIALAVLTALAIFSVSVVATALMYWDFTVRRDGANLRVRRGLLNQRLDTIPLRRIQAIRVEENLVRRLLGFASVKVVVAGRAGGRQARDTGTLLPLARRGEALGLVESVLGRPGLGSAVLAPMPRGARDRRLVRAAGATAAVTLPMVFLLGWIGLTGLAVAVPALWLAVAAYRSLGHGSHDDVVLAKSGVFVQRTTYVPEHSLQSLALTSSPWQRRRRLASVHLQIAHPPGTSDPALIDVNTRDASRIVGELAQAAASAGRRTTPAVTSGAD